ncbi:MAG: aminotransferase class I/II-fold pyridoxal phosphate-dependent enzyme [Candidatus Peribacteraceae bacterium]|nr:aminotransferase class I/II-fold pyridoxal phosphate-dependent enzyme [Candidatus Peribacteraceae bacterium]
MALHPLAAALNDTLSGEGSRAGFMLSRRGKELYFPEGGIVAQGQEACGSALNATLGIALEDAENPLCLSSIADAVSLPSRAVFSYAPSAGVLALRTAWVAHQRERNPALRFPVSLPVVTSGLTHALAIAARLFADEDDEVMLFEPAWDNYQLLFGSECGARLRPVPLFHGGSLNVDGLRSALNAAGNKCILLLNFPNNPTGYTPTDAEARALAVAVRERAERGADTVVLVDDAYAGLVYEQGVFRESMAVLLGDLHERVLVAKIDGASKEEFAWGLRIGFLTFAGKGLTEAGMHALEQKAAGAVRASVSGSCNLSQHLLLKAFASPEYAAERRAHAATLERRYHACVRILGERRRHDLFEVLPCNSGYFLCLRLTDGILADRVRLLLLERFGTGVIALPGNLLRIAFSAVPEDQIALLFSNIVSACEEASGT